MNESICNIKLEEDLNEIIQVVVNNYSKLTEEEKIFVSNFKKLGNDLSNMLENIIKLRPKYKKENPRKLSLELMVHNRRWLMFIEDSYSEFKEILERLHL